MEAKIVTLEEFNSIQADIMLGEKLPKEEANGYVMQQYLPEALECKHPINEFYYILKDNVTDKYCSNFETLTEDWFTDQTP
jgi:hypothetical protein